MRKSILVLGGSGRFGRHTAEAFAAAGWQVTKYDRKTGDLNRQATDVDVILNGWNPIYTDWAREVPALTKRVIRAAKSSGATVILPGNVYVFGHDAPQNFNDTTSHMAQNQMGRIRIEMEAAYRKSGVRTIILRAGDFLDTTASGNSFDMVLLRRIAKGIVDYPGPLNTPHAWAFLPDLARACVQLAEMRHSLSSFEDISFPGYTLTGAELHAAISAALDQKLTLKQMSWLPIRLISPFWPLGRRLVEMSYLWAKPHHLDGAKFVRLLPEFRATSLNAAIAQAVSFHVNPDQPVMRADVAV
ncbi:MAG: sugar nucleotide-binding protein [Alphaproteobacteria bacterium]|nr:sugar nucleotide-binding protein [Alphaproteobacteria bacterium]